jgi:hypothetical protein
MWTHKESRTRAANADFDTPFTVGRSGAVHLNQGTTTPVPTVTHDDEDDILLDGAPHKLSDTWEVFSIGYTGQYSYNGGVMHASEYMGGRLLDDILDTPGTYVIVAVEVDDDPDHPAGWTVLKLKED